ncbi:LytTR family transcriptional regulator DNA-binding domain-containing protein [Desulfitobacterium sp. THU1]|uniref:LytR/AlgR family response regulator transcription factor n=1 Tax=Desulfitobacterium sp. THU1 TaxID=3138072 RepID=UPI00311E0A03
MIHVLIVDDEAPARDELAYLLNGVPEVHIDEMAKNGREALEKIQKLKPEVVFLDIQMPDISGLAVCRELIALLKPDELPFIIFATAYDQHALEAFQVNAIDYVLKPFDEERIHAAIDKVKRLSHPPNPEAYNRILSLLERIPKSKLPIEENERIVLLDPDEIIYCTINGRQVLIQTQKNTYTTNYNLAELEHRLGFLRTHKSYLVNTEKIREIIPWFNGTYNLVMLDDAASTVPVSRTYIKDFRSKIGL